MIDPLSALRRIAERQKLREEFPASVTAEVDAWLQADGIDDAELTDLTALPFVTIDHETSRDLDQAVVVARDGGGWTIWYALADAAYYVRPGSALFEEALKRGASFYFPGFMIPMLPRALSEGIVSLNEGVDRRSLVFRMQVAADGRCTGTQLIRARVRSRHKLSFERVQRLYDEGDDAGLDDGVAESLGALADVGRVRMRDARERDVVRYRRSEVEVHLDGGDDMRFVATGGLRFLVERYNEQLSLLCNVEGARFLAEGEAEDDGVVQAIYRVHPPPEPDRVSDLEIVLRELAKAHGLSFDGWTWKRRGDESLSEFLDRLPTDARVGRVARAVHRQAVIINGRSCFRAEPGIHHGVGAEVYARFSAPMREIVGVFLHKEALERLRGTRLSQPPGALDDDTLRELVVEAANRAKEIQKRITRDANRLVLDQLFTEEPERRWSGTVMGLERGKVHVLFDDPPIDVKVYLSHLSELRDDELSIDDAGVRLEDGNGRTILRLGDAADVTVAGRDERRDRWILDLARK